MICMLHYVIACDFNLQAAATKQAHHKFYQFFENRSHVILGNRKMLKNFLFTSFLAISILYF